MTAERKQSSRYFVGAAADGDPEVQPTLNKPPPPPKGDYKGEAPAAAAAAATTTAATDEGLAKTLAVGDYLEKSKAAAASTSKWTASTALFVLDKTTREQKDKPKVVRLLRFLRDLAGSENYRDVSMVWQRCKEYDELEKDFGNNWLYHVTPIAGAEIKQALSAVNIDEKLFGLVLANGQAATHLCGLIACRYVNYRPGKQAHAGTRAATAYFIQEERRHLVWFETYFSH